MHLAGASELTLVFLLSVRTAQLSDALCTCGTKGKKKRAQLCIELGCPPQCCHCLVDSQGRSSL